MLDAIHAHLPARTSVVAGEGGAEKIVRAYCAAYRRLALSVRLAHKTGLERDYVVGCIPRSGVVVLEDVVTTGGSVNRVLDVLYEKNVCVKSVLAVVCRGDAQVSAPLKRYLMFLRVTLLVGRVSGVFA